MISSHVDLPDRIARVFFVMLALAVSTPHAPAEPSPRKLPTWTLIYVMSYDNDLSPIGAAILDALETGVDETLRVTVLADFVGPDGLQRIAMDGDGRATETLETDDSASEENLAAYFEWALARYPADRYAIVFLNHGGRLDEMALDAAPEAATSTEERWLSARRVGPMLADMQQKLGGAIELVFLQQCGRGSIENLYNFRGAARAILASPTYVGIPNNYYAPTLAWLADHRDVDGLTLARTIADRDEHFSSYVCIRAAELDSLPSRIDAVVAEVAATASQALPNLAADARCFGPYEGEHRFDLLAWLNALYECRDLHTAPDTALSSLTTWVEGKLIAFHRRHPDYLAATRNWCGLSLYVPEGSRLAEMYEDYPLYAASRLDDLWNTPESPGSSATDE